jgi:hypothetical protein
MGSLADLIVATSGDAEAIVASDYPLGTYKGVNVDGLDPLQIAALHSILSNKELSELLEKYEPIAVGSESGPWLVKFPEELIAALGNIAPDNQTAVGNQWVASDPLREAGWSEQDAVGFLARLVHFAQVVSFEDKELYLCAYD